MTEQETETETEGQRPTGTEGQRPNQDPAGGADGSEGQGSEESPEALKARIAALSKEAGGYRTKLREAEGKLQEGERAGLDDLERTRAELADANEERERLRKELTALTVGAAVGKVADQLNFHNPAGAARFIDPSQVVDDDGKVDEAKVAELLRDVVKNEPYLAKPAPAGDGRGGRTRSASTTGGMNDAIRRKARG